MAISVNFPTGVVSVPKADTILTGTDPISGREIRSYNTGAFHEELRDEEETVAGRAWPISHLYNAEVALGGVTYAPQFILVNSYQVEFENGSYRVVFTSTNNNIADFSVVNDVSIQPGNSAGLQIVSAGLDAAQDARLTRVEKFLRNRQYTNPITGKVEQYDDAGTAIEYECPIYSDDGTTAYDGTQPIERRDRFETP